MGMKTSIFFLTYFLISSVPAFGAEIIFDADTRVKMSGAQNFSDQKAGTSIELKPGSDILILSKKNFPMIIMTPQSGSSKVKITDGLMEQVLTEQIQPAVQSATSDILKELKKTELLIQKRELNQALAIVTVLKQKYKNISSILFMSGTVFYLLNNKTNAIEDLEAGLKLDPTDEAAKKLLERLKGAS